MRDRKKHNACQKRYYKNHKEKERLRIKKYREDNPEKIKAYKEKNKDRNSITRRKYREKLLEKDPDYDKKNHQKYKEQRNVYSKKYREEHPKEKHIRIYKYAGLSEEEIKEIKRKYQEEYRLEHLAAEKKRNRQWWIDHPEEYIIKRNNRRVKTLLTPKELRITVKQWRELLEEYNYKCAYCGKEIKLSMDHIKTLSRGGLNTKENMVPACRHCNCSKGTKTCEEWGHFPSKF
jgi:5-methylcytosine-specific restriction endonuclease McrA